MTILKEAEARDASIKPKGDISISDLIPGTMGVQYDGNKEFTLKLDSRDFILRAESPFTAKEWVDTIKLWQQFLG